MVVPLIKLRVTVGDPRQKDMIMVAPIEWLETQLEVAKRNLEEIQVQYQEAQKRFDEAQRRVMACSEMLAVARMEQDSAGEDRTKAVFRGRRIGVRPQMNMPDQIEKLLREHGPLRAEEIYVYLKEEGRDTTTVNSINTQLRLNKPARFDRNKDGKWYLVASS
jgi:hypothetical protein